MQSKVIKLTTFAGIKTLVYHWFLASLIMYPFKIKQFLALLIRSYDEFKLVIFKDKLDFVSFSKLILFEEFRNSK